MNDEVTVMMGRKKPLRYCEYQSGKDEENACHIHNLLLLEYHNFELYARQKVSLPEDIT